MDGTELIFDESWELRPDSTEARTFWRDSPATEAVPLLKSIILNNYKVEFAKNQAGLLVVHLPEFNIEVNVLPPSGLSSRRGEPYSVGDILLFTTVRREDYTYSSVTRRGFKYINVIERDRLKSLLEESKVSPELLDFKVEYGPIDKGADVKIPGKSLDGPAKTTSTKVPVKKILENLYNELATLAKPYEELCGVTDEASVDANHLRALKKAKHDYLNTFVFAACVQERPVRTRNSLLTAHGEGFEKILHKADTAEAPKKAPKGHDPGALGGLVATRRFSSTRRFEDEGDRRNLLQTSQETHHHSAKRERVDRLAPEHKANARTAPVRGRKRVAEEE